MTIESISTLVPSTNAGRYALDDPVSGPDVTSGQPLAVLICGYWIEGRVEHAGNLYVSRRSGQAERGYSFIANDGTMCGLCAGMQVRRC
jgi:Domain of unknown function (DUF5348)